MDLQNIKQYIDKKVFFTLKNGFRYKIILKEEYVIGDTISFPDKYNNPVSINLSEISFITISKENGENKNG